MMTRSIVAAALCFAMQSVLHTQGKTPGPVAPAAGWPPASVVAPTGIYPADVQNVQAALDRGGMVWLRSRNAAGVPTAFNFGPADAGGATATITKNVAIFGELGAPARTTIAGGLVPFSSDAKVLITLANVRFVGPGAAAVVLNASSGAAIIGNEVTDVAGAVNSFGSVESHGMKFIAADRRSFSGHLIVSGNLIHNLSAGFAEGLVFQSVGARVTVSFNRITSVESSGITVFEPGGDVAITDNVVAPGAGSGGDFALGNGVQLYGTAGGSYHVERNTITCTNPNADGLIVAGGFNWLTFEPGPPVTGAVIRRNEVSMLDSCCGAISIFDNVSSSTVSQNTLRGTAAWAVGLVPTGLVELAGAAANRFVDNRIDQFDPSLAHVVFFSHTSENVWRGPSGIIIDFGIDNVFVD
jgi:hypothetical protein